MAVEQDTLFETTAQPSQRGTAFKYDNDAKTLSYLLADGAREYLKDETIIGVRNADNAGQQVLIYVEESAGGVQESGSEELGLKVSTVETDRLPKPFVEEFRILLQPDADTDHTERSNPSVSTHVIVSKLSGPKKASAFFENILKPLLTELKLQEDKHYVVHYTKSTQTITDLTAQVFLPQANKGLQQRIILLSGDGGVVDILNALHIAPHTDSYAEPVVAILPMGTGNALAHSYGVTKDRTGGLATLARGVARHLPVLKARFSTGARLLVDEGRQEETLALHEDKAPVMYGAVVCSWGLHAGLVADSDTAEYRKFGAERFKMAAKEALYPSDGSEPHHYKAKVSLLKRSADGNEEWTAIDRSDHAYVLTTIVSNLEDAFIISPASKPFDGHLRVVHFGHVDGNGFMRLMNLAYQGGKHVEDEVVSYDVVGGVRIEFQGLEQEPRWRRICIDGKIVRVEEDGWVEVRKDEAPVIKLISLS